MKIRLREKYKPSKRTKKLGKKDQKTETNTKSVSAENV